MSGYHVTYNAACRFVMKHADQPIEVRQYWDRHNPGSGHDHGVWNITDSHWVYVS